ncbi:MAG: HD-GYP domain-containing protein [Treponema sp.]|jgi:HD-GYP domain-containing protein (c-di-GMP phosphodiesterase class II)|nr:HD-GYP domain-containing protein [Treponema sp.]
MGNTAYAEDEWQKTYQSYLELIEWVDAVFVKITLNHCIVADCMESVVDKVYQERRRFLEFVIGAQGTHKVQAKNAVDAGILASVIADRMHLSFTQNRTVIEAALLHDVGMLCIPQEILEKPESLSKAEQWYILTHPLQSYKVIGRELHCFEDVALIALQHHESWNGEGYPKRLAGADIELESRIIAVADAFTAMITERPYRRAFGGHQAMKNLVSNTMIQFDPEVLKAFVHLMGMYPVGSMVELNNGAAARVLEYAEGVPLLKPRVRLIQNGTCVDLLSEKGLLIKKSLERKDILMNMSETADQDKLTG